MDPKMRKIVGWILLALAAWGLISPQSILGVTELKWMANYAFPGEVMVSLVVICVAYWLLDFKVDLSKSAGEH
jgi:hypothetical protein